MRRRLVAGERQLPLMVLLIGLSITAVVTEQNRSLNKQTHERIEAALMGDVSDAIQMKLRKAVDTISSVAGLFNASTEVSRQEFGK